MNYSSLVNKWQLHVHKEIIAPFLIIKWNNYINQINIKPNFAHYIQIIAIIANMGLSVVLLTMKAILLLNWYIIWYSMTIFIFFIIKLYGVHSTIFNMTEASVYMHIIGKIIEENHKYINMTPKHAVIGNLMIL